MSELDDAESKTEEPTEKKINDALEQGNTPVARDVPVVVGFIGLLICVYLIFETTGARLIEAFALIMENSGSVDFRNSGDAVLLLAAVMVEVGKFLGPTLGVLMFGGLAAAFMQGTPQLAGKRVYPDLSRISPRSGWKRIFGLQGFIELAKTLFKIAIIGSGIAFILMVDRPLLTDALRVEPRVLPGLAQTLLMHLLSIVCVVGGLLAGADLAWSKLKWRQDLRMSRQELKEEIKQAEGDAFVKARMRSLAQSRARKRMMSNVPRATFVITNPTHYAIALRYTREEGGAPIVVAKGKELIALKIREIADSHNIPIFEKKELVRAMFDHVEVDRMIPSEFYRPIAELIHFLSQASNGRPR